MVAPRSIPRTLQLLQSGQPLKIVCFGDSITGIYYHTGGRRAWGDLLGLALQRLHPSARIEIINAGISSQTTADALQRVDPDVLAPAPQLVALMFGMNDTARLPPETYRANLRELAQRILATGAELIFMTPNAVEAGDALRPPERVRAYAEIMRDVGNELHVPIADTYAAFQSIQTNSPQQWPRLMSDAIHPNLRGHILLAETVAQALTGQPVSLGELPVLYPRLPHTSARLESGQPLEVVAMKPFDTHIGPALRRIFPAAEVRVTAWDPAGKSLPTLEAEAKQIGWWKFFEHPELAKPDLIIVAVPASVTGNDEAHFLRSYGWVLNWSQAMGKPQAWDCLGLLPSVAQPDLNASESAVEALALEAMRVTDLPVVQRLQGDTTSIAELLTRQLEAMFKNLSENP